MRTVDENTLAYSGRLHYSGIPGLDASASTYITEVEGFRGDTSFVSLFDVEALYRVPRTGLELRGDFAYWHIADPEELVANNNAAANDDVGGRMYGWYAEVAYHLWPDAWKEGRGDDMDSIYNVIKSFTGWRGFDPDLGFWQPPTVTNTVSAVLFLLCCIAVAYVALTAKRRPRVAQIAFLVVAVVQGVFALLWAIGAGLVTTRRPLVYWSAWAALSGGRVRG